MSSTCSLGQDGPSVDAADLVFASFRADLGGKCQGAVQVWENARNEFIPFLDFPPPLRLVVYTTNPVESMNFQLQKITENRGHIPDSDAAMKLLCLGLRNISSNRGGDSGTGTYDWKEALNTPATPFPGRLKLR